MIKYISTFLVLTLFSFNQYTVCEESTAPPPSIHAITPKSIDGKDTPLSHYAGKVLLIVNTASKCGFTPQYHDLQNLYTEYNQKGVEILGFPSNDFNEQEPGTNSEIKSFCTLHYGVTFPLFQKNPVSGDAKQELFKSLTEKGPKELQGEVQWNFEKFVVDKKGLLRARFGSFVNPESSRIKEKIDELLKE